MNSLSDLNSWANQSISVTDNRPANVIWDIYPDFPFANVELDLANDGVEGANPVNTEITTSTPDDIIEIVNWSTANLTVVWDIECGVPCNMEFGTPTNVNVDYSGTAQDIYTLTGFQSVNDWNEVNTPIFVIQDTYTTLDIFYIKVTASWWNEDANTQITKSWYVYDPLYFYSALLISEFTTNIVPTKIKTVNVTLTAEFNIYTGLYLNSEFSMTCNAQKQKALVVETGLYCLPYDPMLINIAGSVASDKEVTLKLYPHNNSRTTVDWGDGSPVTISSNSYIELTHMYDANSYVLSIEGMLESADIYGDIVYGLESWGNGIIGNDLGSVHFGHWDGWGTGGVSTGPGCPNFTTVPTHIPSWITNTSQMFVNCTNFNSASLKTWDVGNVTNMWGMFLNTNISQDLSSWDVSSVTDMGYMFAASSTPTTFTGWDVSSVTDMNSMFMLCGYFSADISGWDVNSVNDMGYMFYKCVNFNIDIGSWDVSSVTDMEALLYDASSFNKDLSGWDVSNVTEYGLYDSGATSWQTSYKPTFN